MRMVREWRHLKMLKRAGRAYDPLGIENTPPGSLALLCRACPQPTMNLPQGWETADPSKRCVETPVAMFNGTANNHIGGCIC